MRIYLAKREENFSISINDKRMNAYSYYYYNLMMFYRYWSDVIKKKRPSFFSFQVGLIPLPPL